MQRLLQHTKSCDICEQSRNLSGKKKVKKIMNKKINLLILTFLISCSQGTSLQPEVELSMLPEYVTRTKVEKEQLHKYEGKIKSMDVAKVEAELKSSSDKTELQVQINKLISNYNSCVAKLKEVENNQASTSSDLKNCIDQLDVIMQYIVSHYKV